MAKIAEKKGDMAPVILGIESSCDETAAAVLVGGRLRSNVVAGQQVHAQWGGVVPELASRAHQEHMVPVVHQALEQAGITVHDLDAVAFTQGPGLMGALLVGTCFAKSLALAAGKPLVAVDHMQAHVLAHFIVDDQPREQPAFPFLNLTVSGGHTQLVLVRSPLDMEVIGATVDDAAGEAFDKGAKLLGLPYPGGPLVDRWAALGDATRYNLPLPRMDDLRFSFSGTKTAFREVVLPLRDAEGRVPEALLPDLCASLQRSILDQLFRQLKAAVRATGITHVGIAGGVSANSGLRARLQRTARQEGWQAFIPPFDYCTDNAAMIAMAGHFLHLAGRRAAMDTVPLARFS